MKHYLQKYAKPKTKAELEQGIYDFWSTMTPEKCCKYIGHLRKVIPEIVKRHGRASGFWLYCIYWPILTFLRFVYYDMI